MAGKRRVLVFLLVFVIFLNFIPYPVISENSPPQLTGGTVTPRKSYPNIDYLYTVTYTDSDNDAPTYIKVFIDDEEYVMEEVDPTDSNFTDGKDYSFKKVMVEGAYAIYYQADDGNGSEVATNSFTLSVTWDVGHYDIIHFIEDEVFPGLMLLLAIVFILVVVMCVISILMVLQMRRIAKGLEGKGKGEDEEKDEKESKD